MIPIGESMPPGFEVAEVGADSATIRYRTTGMKGIGCFFVFFLGIWTPACVVGTYTLVTGNFKNFFGACFGCCWLSIAWPTEIILLRFCLWYFWGVTSFVFTPDRLVAVRTLWGLRRERVFERAEMRTLEQVKDGGGDEDSFPSWGLVLELDGEKRVKLLHRQPIEVSGWFGPVVAAWAGVPFVPWAEKPKEKPVDTSFAE